MTASVTPHMILVFCKHNINYFVSHVVFTSYKVNAVLTSITGKCSAAAVKTLGHKPIFSTKQKFPLLSPFSSLSSQPFLLFETL